MQDFGARVLCATPSYALNIAEVAEGMGVDLPQAAAQHRHVRRRAVERRRCAARLEERLGIRAVDIYGLSEIIGPGRRLRMRTARDGLHGWEDHFLFEVIDPEDAGAASPPGEAGELVITTLTKEALPMVRYRTRDITRLDARALRLRPHAMSASCASPAATTTC